MTRVRGESHSELTSVPMPATATADSFPDNAAAAATAQALQPGFDPLALSASWSAVEAMYDKFSADITSVDATWHSLFACDETGDQRAEAGQPWRGQSPSVPLHSPAVPGPRREARSWPRFPTAECSAPEDEEESTAAYFVQLNVWQLINAYRSRGHLAAHLDPLAVFARPRPPDLDPSNYGFGPGDLHRVIEAGDLHGMDRAALRDIVAKLSATYSGSLGVEFMHMSEPTRKQWLARRMETGRQILPLDAEMRRGMLELVVAADTFEEFCRTNFPGTERFSLTGSEGLIPLLDLVLLHLAHQNVAEVVIGMASRGRLNVLAHVMGHRPRDIFAEFQDVEPEATLGCGDLKYHLGYSSDRLDRFGKNVHLSLTFNPSHVEVVSPVVEGRVRAKQCRRHDSHHRYVAGVVIHGDAAFCGQGLVPETLNLTNLHGFRTGGTIHIILNNRICRARQSLRARETPYCSDLAKMIECPIFHVNGEDLDALARAIDIAIGYRQQFQSDVFIDLFGYRKFSDDDAEFIPPRVYRRMGEKASLAQIYGEKLVAEGVISESEIASWRKRYRRQLRGELRVAKCAGKRPRLSAMGGLWSNYVGGREAGVPDPDTGVKRRRLEAIVSRMNTLPEGLELQPKVRQILQDGAAKVRGDRPVDWALAELLAFGSILWEGQNVRLTGQDSSRGTFSQRHAVVVDSKSGYEHTLLANLHPGQGECRICDSPVTEAAVLAFEFGYSLDYPDALVVWEAQFGDFANGAQVIIDQFISSSEDKWNRLSGITLLLPHGYEGQGPEHSSARIERYLQAAAEDNMQICQPTTPVQMFHLLRRQVLRPWRKPLIIATPKSLLRHPQAVSSIEEFTAGRFCRLLSDPHGPAAEDARRVILCSGKVYYDLAAERSKRGDGKTALVRVEQFYPWRDKDLVAEISRFGGVEELIWVQEEPANMGGGEFVMPRLARLFPEVSLRWVARESSASPATGSYRAHLIEQELLLRAAFDGPLAARGISTPSWRRPAFRGPGA